ncbi:hypothetical protein [Naasia aerilata]|uniref:Uncharacterized protein n=1 Tax=Naasia aerilata TaxID=1162966 RepID=A0ABM8GE77_9MICO|nr:hypothetical protein [Naasia aerilata]BDZ46582.1 hypothetical protein GCM10025866_24910 [Naasia aerilata]
MAGLTFAATLSLAREALVVLLGSAIALTLGLVAWVMYSVLAPLAGAGPVGRATTELLSALTIEGISTLPLALLPLLALDGAALFAWKRWAWGLSYAVGLAAFLLVMVTVPDSWGTVDGDYVRWVAVFAAFAGVAVGVWATHVFLERRKAGREVGSVAGLVAIEVDPEAVQALAAAPGRPLSTSPQPGA